MGISILELVLQKLRDGGFAADVAYPGQKYPPITQTVAAVHIAEVDRANMTVTVEVTVISPAELGGTACEMEALRATEVLRWAGAGCVQRGCDYDGMAQVYCVSILATFTCITEADSCAMGPGFAVHVDGTKLEFVSAFSNVELREVECYYEMGEDYPVGMGTGKSKWEITIEEVIPAGSEEVIYPNAATGVTVEKSNGETEIFRDCLFTSVQRENTNAGLKRTWKGIAMKRGVEISGEDIL